MHLEVEFPKLLSDSSVIILAVITALLNLDFLSCKLLAWRNDYIVLNIAHHQCSHSASSSGISIITRLEKRNNNGTYNSWTEFCLAKLKAFGLEK